RPCTIVTRDVAQGRQVRFRNTSQQPPVCRRARERRRTASGVEGTRLEALEGSGAAGDCARARWLRDHARPGPLARVDDSGVQEVSGLARAVLQERSAVPGRRTVEAARPPPDADATCRAG